MARVKQNIRSLKQAINAIKQATYDTRLSRNELNFYRWIITQHKHKHVFASFPRYLSNHWENASFIINQKHKR